VADDAGALLVRSGLVSTSALEEARARMASLGGTIGEQLVALGAIGDDALTDFYRSRLLVPQVNPNTLARLPMRVVTAIPSDMAIELRAVPVALDAENNLTVAMSDPSDRHAVDEIAFFTGAYVVRAVATQLQIAWCLAHYYGHVTALCQRLLQTAEPATAREVAPAPAPAPAPVPRVRGVTGKIDALRHRAIAPITSPIDVPRPQLDAIEASSEAPASPASPASDGVPERPRARSISGEIRVPSRRAPSIKPQVPAFEEDSGPIISIVAEIPDDDATAPRPAPPRRRVVKTDPPELAARAGEVAIATDRERRVDDAPGVIIDEQLLAPPAAPAPGELDDDLSSGVVVVEAANEESVPILLEQRRTTARDRSAEHASSAPDGAADDVVVLEPKPRAQRPDRRTQIGIGALSAVTRAHRDTEASLPAMLVEDLDALDADGPTTSVMTAIPQRAADVGPAHLAPSFHDHDPVDDGWGPPGSTIPPPLLGAIPGGEDSDEPGVIPVPDLDSAPLIVAPPSPPEVTRGAPGDPAHTAVRALEDATSRLLELIRALERAAERDEVVSLMVAHLAESHRRAGFFVLRPTATRSIHELGLFSIQPRQGALPTATLRLDKPSTLQDVVGTRLPYRGPMHDDLSRGFLATVLGTAPAEILLVPVAVRERVVGVLFGEQRLRHTFDDQLALASRAAGMALERILKARRG